MYHAACKVEFQLFNRSCSQLTFFSLQKKRQWLRWRVGNNSQTHDVNQRLLKRQEETHPHDEQKPIPNSENCCNRRKDYNSSRLRRKHKLWWKMHCQESRGLPDKNLNSPPTTAMHKRIITVKPNSIHPFSQNIEITRRWKWPSIIHQVRKVILV